MDSVRWRVATGVSASLGQLEPSKSLIIPSGSSATAKTSLPASRPPAARVSACQPTTAPGAAAQSPSYLRARSSWTARVDRDASPSVERASDYVVETDGARAAFRVRSWHEGLGVPSEWRRTSPSQAGCSSASAAAAHASEGARPQAPS